MTHPLIAERDWEVSAGGHRLACTDRHTVWDPRTGDRLTDVPDLSPAHVDELVQAAARAQRDWAARPPRERGRVLRQLAMRVRELREEFAQLDALDGGFTLSAMRTDVDAAADLIELFADFALELGGRTIPVSENLHFTTQEPYGVVARIGAFNHPFFFAAGKVGAPLMAGNAVLLKAPDQAPLSTLRFAEVAAEILPPDLVLAVTGRGAVSGHALVTHPQVRRIGFIGSTATGLRIQQDAAAHGVAHVSLELGGKNAQIVFDDADPDRAAAAAVAGMNFTWTAGQSCGSTSRLLVHEDIAEDVIARVSARVDAIRVGDPMAEDTEMGPLVSQAQYDKSVDAIRRAREEGGRVRAGGGRPDGIGEQGWYLRPTVIDEVRAGSFLEQTEIFGPVLAVTTFRTEDEAVAIANGVEYGLTAAVWTRDIDRALRVSRRIDAGYVLVNSHSRHFWGLPFGGTKSSGVGREESVEELLSYTETKTTTVVIS